MERLVPKYRALPQSVEGFHCSWSYFNSLCRGDEQRDQLGTLNFLEPERVARAAREEIREGISISLDLPVDYFSPVISAFGGRSAPIHSIKQVAPFCCEDTITFNTQSSSQWDGLRHFGIRSSGEFYNGYRQKDFEDGDVLGIDAWIKRAGIFGRAVLIDFKAWFDSHGETLQVNDGQALTLADVLAVLNSQKTSVRPGDILIFRTGWLEWYNSAHPAERYNELCVKNAPGEHRFIGLAQEEGFVEWLWDNQIAAVAGDQVAFESTPPTGKWLHEHLLGALGCPIGELWDTERVSKECARRGRYSFFLASTPLFISGAVASPANATVLM